MAQLNISTNGRPRIIVEISKMAVNGIIGSRGVLYAKVSKFLLRFGSDYKLVSKRFIMGIYSSQIRLYLQVRGILSCLKCC